MSFVNKIDVSIIIVNYNAGEYIVESVKSIKESINKSISYEVIVVDNASADFSMDMLEEKFSDILFIRNKENYGYSRANNIGIKKSAGRYVLFLNPDTVLHKNTLETMVSFMDKTDDAGASTCVIRMENGKLDDGCHRGFPTPWNAFCYFSGIARVFPHSTFFNGYHMGWKDMNKIHKIDSLVGAFMLVRREAGEDVKWWDEDYFFYGEDLEFCFQLKEKGWSIYFVPTVEVLHHKGVTAGIKKVAEVKTTADKETKIRATNARFNAMRIFYKKHYMKKYPGLITWGIFLIIDIKKSLALRSL